ncbi:MAG TPA: S-methyl-5-thioribose-1-phosphate isomerase [Armatimonadota bacterium]|jgi:methylthioribose-1-phosphate isomerase
MKPTVYWEDGCVVMLDQNLLPHEERYVSFRDWRDVAEAIRIMTVRGAPAIGVTAALGLALAARNIPDAGFDAAFREACDAFAATRPTAVNLFWAIEQMKGTAASSRGSERADALLREALRIADEDLQANRAMGRHGAALLEDGDGVLTHCNAGALATSGYGTALGVIRAAVEQGKRLSVFADETRPRLQGLRLTAWELMRDGIDVTVIPDNASGAVMRAGWIQAVVVGADRIAANGDTANKIGTYNVAVLARHHHIPFYVVAPLSTVDASLPNGRAIPIEQRDPAEVTHIDGHAVGPEGVPVFNPAFDVTPAELIAAIITERGVYRPPFGFHRRNNPC